MDAKELGEIRERWAKATPGPWGVPGANIYRVLAKNPLRAIVDNTMPTDTHFGAEDVSWPQTEEAAHEAAANAEAIAHAPEDVRRLLERVEELEVEAVLPCGHHRMHECSVSGTQHVRGYPEDVDAEWCEVCEEQIGPHKSAVAELEAERDEARAEAEALRAGVREVVGGFRGEDAMSGSLWLGSASLLHLRELADVDPLTGAEKSENP